MNMLDNQTIDITCPKCRTKRTERLGKLKTNPKLTCTGCGSALAIQADQLRSGVNKVEKSIADLKRSLGRFGK